MTPGTPCPPWDSHLGSHKVMIEFLSRFHSHHCMCSNCRSCADPRGSFCRDKWTCCQDARFRRRVQRCPQKDTTLDGVASRCRIGNHTHPTHHAATPSCTFPRTHNMHRDPLRGCILQHNQKRKLAKHPATRHIQGSSCGRLVWALGSLKGL